MGTPWIIGGDFNITRFAHKRKCIDHYPRDRKMFNDVISQLRLTDLPLNNRLFMWSDMRKKNLNLAKLDMILICKEWNSKFSLADLRPYKEPPQIMYLYVWSPERTTSTKGSFVLKNSG